jgi:hypothetical protein
MNSIRKDSGPNDPTLNDAPSELYPPAWRWFAQLLVAKITVETGRNVHRARREPHHRPNLSIAIDNDPNARTRNCQGLSRALCEANKDRPRIYVTLTVGTGSGRWLYGTEQAERERPRASNAGPKGQISMNANESQNPEEQPLVPPAVSQAASALGKRGRGRPKTITEADRKRRSEQMQRINKARRTA